MSETEANDEQARELLRASRLSELHGDGRCERWAEALRDPETARRDLIHAALEQCGTWWRAVPGARPTPVWQPVREGVHELTDRLAIAVNDAGRLLTSWGSRARDLLQAGLDLPPLPVPQRVALGEADNLDARAGTVAFAALDDGGPCEIQAFAGKDGAISLAVRMPPSGGAHRPWSAELWREERLLQRLPSKADTVQFTRPLSAGRHRLVLRVGHERYRIEIEVA